MDECQGCGFAYDLATATCAPAEIESGVAEIAYLLRGDDPILRDRPEPDTWSPLEYGCHVRDVLLVQRERVLLARRAQRPSFPPMGRDERAEHDGYAEQLPADVARQLVDAGHLLTNDLDRLGPSDWDRTMIYNYPTSQERSLRWVAVHTLHEVRHHLADIRRQVG